MLNLFFSFLASYLLGSIPTAYIYGRVSKGIDIRNYGSRNIGATNTLRVLGKKAGLIVLSADLIKGLIAVLFIAGLFYRLAPAADLLFLRLVAGIGAVLGHTYSLFLKFRGGKGVATTAGVLLGVVPLSAVWTFAVWLGFLFLFGYVSLASICASLFLPLSIILFYAPEPQFLALVLFAIIISSVVIVKHKANIVRLIYKQEKKIFRVYA